MPGLTHCLVGEGLRLTTRHTGLPITENLSRDQFLIPSSWRTKAMREAICLWQSSTEQAALPMIKSYIEPLQTAKNRNEFADQLNALLVAAFVEKRLARVAGLQRVLQDLLIALWTKDCVIWPSVTSVADWPKHMTPAVVWGSAQSLIEQATVSIDPQRPRFSPLYRSFMRLMLSRSFVDDLMALGPRSDAVAMGESDKMGLSSIAKVIVSLQRQIRPDAEHYGCEDFTHGGLPKPGSRSDPEFRWIIQKNPKWETWRGYAALHMAPLRKNRNRTLRGLNYFMDYADEHQLPVEPEEFFSRTSDRTYPAFSTDGCGNVPRNAIINRFLDFVLADVRERLISQDRDKLASRLRNPIPVSHSASLPKSAETHRDPMPQHLIKLCLDILTENEFAWSKSFMKEGESSDWIARKDPVSGQKIQVWSPVRTMVLIAKLLLPARTMQIRMLDSGEADTERYDPAQRAWHKNTGNLAPKNSKMISNGVFRAYPREDGSRGSLIYFNTNKTSDSDQPIHKRGHLMPWENQEALKLFGMLRDWQEQFNPLATPTPWKDLGKLRDESPGDMALRGTACFLFRDPTALNPTLPITNKKVQLMWGRLMEEAEQRLAAKGERKANGDPIQLVLSRYAGRPSRMAYDLHSLRVTMITSLFDNGVPVDRLMKIAGHCAAVMTLYYVKQTSEKISIALDEANAKRQSPKLASTEWNRYLQTSGNEPRSIGGTISVSKPQTAPIIFMDHGVCLRGSQECRTGDGAKSSHCVQCPHFATGPAFLPGLQAECDALLASTCEAGRAYQKAQEVLPVLRLKQARSELFTEQHKIDAATAKMEQCRDNVDRISRSLVATYTCAQQCLKLTADSEHRISLMTTQQTLRTLQLIEPTDQNSVLNRLFNQAAFYESQKTDIDPVAFSRLRFLEANLNKAQVAKRFGFLEPPHVRQAVAQQAKLWIDLRSFSPQSKAVQADPLSMLAASLPELILRKVTPTLSVGLNVQLLKPASEST